METKIPFEELDDYSHIDSYEIMDNKGNYITLPTNFHYLDEFCGYTKEQCKEIKRTIKENIGYYYYKKWFVKGDK